ncbi:MAG: hypothetical protein HY057_14390 [Rhodospirillales bacterium]|nr:hypothetical protein [Rhodospirillales bacterium]
MSDNKPRLVAINGGAPPDDGVPAVLPLPGAPASPFPPGFKPPVGAAAPPPARDVTEPPQDRRGDSAGSGDESGRVDPGPCPVRALGRLEGAYYFASLAGEIHVLRENQLFTRGGVARLFDGNTFWLRARFPTYDKDGKPSGGWTVASAAEYLMRGCAARPIWDLATPLRGRGVWSAGAASDARAGLLIHCGDAVGFLGAKPPPAVQMATAGVADGALSAQWCVPGFRFGRAIYRAMPPVAFPAKEPAGPDIARQLVEDLSLWRFREPNAPLLTAGAIAAGALGAALPWRSHLVIVGQEGSGKSTLIQLMEAASVLALVFDEFSEAGVRDALAGEARLFFLDEGEGDERGDGLGAVERAIRLIRRFSGGTGMRGVRGSPGGHARRFQATGAAVLGAILPPDFEPQDATRFTRLDLDRLPAEADREAVATAIERWIDLAPALWARMIAGRARYFDNLKAVRGVLAEIGCDPRHADQPGNLLAAFATLERDEPLDIDAAKKLVLACRFAVSIADGVDENSGPRRCLDHLLSARGEIWGGGFKRTIGQQLVDATDARNVDVREHLESIGIRVWMPGSGLKPDRPGFYVANRFEGLTRIYVSTRWSGNKWADDLQRLEGALAAGTIRIGGSKPRATFIPAAYLTEKEDPMPEKTPIPP